MSREPAPDAVELVGEVARGNREAFGRFYDRYASLVFSFALRLLRARSEAEDLLQEVFFQAWRQAATYDPARGHPEAWLLTITRSRGIDKLRSMRKKSGQTVSMEDRESPSEAGVVASGAARSEARLTVTGALAELPDAQRRVLELAYFDGLTQSEIAARLGEPLGTVKTRMRTGLERLRGFLGSASGASGS
jgi:RNA polymerase sigma-70 factor, ECF subfamily